MRSGDTLQGKGYQGHGPLVLVVFAVAVMIACAAGWPLTAFAEPAPPVPRLLASHDLGGGYSDNVSIDCVSEDGRYVAVSSVRGEYAMTYVVDLDTGERRRLPDVDYGYDFFLMNGSRALAMSADGLMLCDLATSELEPLSIDLEGDVSSCNPLEDGTTVGLAMTDGDGTYTCVVFDVDAQAVTKQVSLPLPEVSSIYIADDASQIFVITQSDDGDAFCSVYGFDGAAPERSVALSDLDSDYAHYFLINQIDASTMEVLNISSATGRLRFERLDTETGNVEPLVDAATSWELSYGGALLAFVDPQQRFGDTVSADALERLEMRSVDLASGETRYQCQVPAALYGCTLQFTDLSRDGRYFYTPNDVSSMNGASSGLSSLSVVDVGSGAVTNLPLALADGSHVAGMLLSEDDSRLVLLTVDDADGSLNMALSVYDTGIGGDPVAALLANTPVLIIIGVAVLVIAVLVVAVLVFIGRRRRLAAPIAATVGGGPAASAPSFCPQCGQRIEAPDAAFCPHCGAPLRR